VSQAIAAAPPPNVPAAAPAGSGRPAPGMPGQRGAVASRAGADLPTRLSALRLLAVAVCLVFGALTAGQLVLSWQANRAAAADTEQLIRVQNLRANLLRADALATNAFLVGGLEPPAQRAAYDTAIESTTRDIAAAAQAQPADEAALSALNVVVQAYASAMEQARANNRQGFPVGSAYLSTASSELRTRALPIMDALVTANSQRATDSMGNQRPVWILVPGLLTLGALVAANQWIATRFKRRINLGLALAAGCVLVATAASALASAQQLHENNLLRDGAYERVVQGSQVRSLANDAKANESLRLIARGSGKAFETSWGTAAGTLEGILAKDTVLGEQQSSWARYASGHKEVVALDEGGNWDGAVALATNPAADAPSAAFATFDDGIRELVDKAGAEAKSTLGGKSAAFLALVALSALAGLAAAFAAWRGVSRRLEEYA
jgi:hypothetical protein